MAKGVVGLAFPQSRDVGELVGEDVIIGAVGEFGGRSGPAVAFVEVAVARDVFEILDERPVEPAGGAPRAFAGSEAVARPESTGPALEVGRVAWAFGAVDREAVGGVAEEVHRDAGSGDGPVPEQAGREAVVVVRSPAPGCGRG